MFAVRRLPSPLLVVVVVDYHPQMDCSLLAHLFSVHFVLHSERLDPIHARTRTKQMEKCILLNPSNTHPKVLTEVWKNLANSPSDCEMTLTAKGLSTAGSPNGLSSKPDILFAFLFRTTTHHTTRTLFNRILVSTVCLIIAAKILNFNATRCTHFNFIDGKINYKRITRFTKSVTSSMNTTTIAIIFYMWVFSLLSVMTAHRMETIAILSI